MLAFAGTFVVLVLAAVFAWIYFSQNKTETRQATIESNLLAPTATPLQKPTPATWASGKVVPVFPEKLRVTSTSMGKTPLAIVNGKRVAQGDWVDVTTDNGVATVVVEKIDDGVVHFRNGEMTIDVKLVPRFTPKPLQQPAK